MKKKGFTFLAALIIAVSIFGQSPEKISYQAVVRDATNATVANQVVGMQISILQDGTLENPGSAVYVETQTPTTNANGLLSIYIGAGTAVTGTFSGIAWSNVPHYIKIEIDPSGNNTNYTITGTTQLVSVPFALYAKTAGDDVLKENAANKSTDFVTDAASDVKFPSVKSVKTYVDTQYAPIDALIEDLETATVGDFRAGGVVFWVDPADNTRGLVCAIEDQDGSTDSPYSGNIQWSPSYYDQSTIIGARDTAIGTGSANTTAIIAHLGGVEIEYAAGLARAYRGGGFDDWFLPSIDELSEMYLKMATINTTAMANGGAIFASDGVYWSSTEHDISFTAWHQSFHSTGGHISEHPKFTFLNMRAVRAFSNSLAGAQGIQGATGSAGADGANGANGEKGATGDQGSQGTQGETGSAGADGTNGTNGDNGDQGIQGLQGIAGTNGDTGFTGAQGIQGAIGSAGADGATGADGANGEKGATGDQGAQGTQGQTGSAGANGTNGTNGDNGDQGIQGFQGIAGTNGDTGVTGDQGAAGATGPAGADGTNGTNGTDGATGLTGPAGADGTNGTNGTDGATGATGGYPVHTIGESYGGGIVFYVYDGGQHGLIAAIADQSRGIRWYGGTNTNTRARADGVGTGLKNTAIIIANQGPVDGGAFAATVCNEYSVTVGGTTYGDWYLPSKYELNLLYLQRTVVGGFADYVYWSSTEIDNGNAWRQNFPSGNHYSANKYRDYYVRAVRAF
jgi:hypothetical protein